MRRIPAQGFLPQAGPLQVYREPRAPRVRVDGGVVEGGTVSVHYDPLLAKVIVHADTRSSAIGRAAAALRDFPILGIRTNVPYLLAVLEHPAFSTGDVDTRFLDRETPAILEAVGGVPTPEAALAAAGAAFAAGSQPRIAGASIQSSGTLPVASGRQRGTAEGPVTSTFGSSGADGRMIHPWNVPGPWLGAA